MAKCNIEGEAHIQKEVCCLDTTLLKVQAEGIFFWKEEQIFIDFPTGNQLKVCQLSKNLIDRHYISRKLYVFNEREQYHNLLAVNYTPKLAEWGLHKNAT